VESGLQCITKSCLYIRCSTLERIGSDFNLGLKVTGGLTFGPKPGVVDKGHLKIF